MDAFGGTFASGFMAASITASKHLIKALSSMTLPALASSSAQCRRSHSSLRNDVKHSVQCSLEQGCLGALQGFLWSSCSTSWCAPQLYQRNRFETLFFT